jgi:putative radical SAM enzyme (TIGR03279 family)
MSRHSTFKRPGGIKVRSLPGASDFYKAGLRRGDRIVSVNGEKISDELEFRYCAASPYLQCTVLRNGQQRTVIVERKHGDFLEIEFYQKAIRRCANKCIFCFIDQMPPRMRLRRRLYVKDEDLTHSFLNGNYVTLTNTGTAELQRIVHLGLSPLFISVHATDPLVRNRMLGIKRAPLIMEQLSFLALNNIRFHTQIVVCPGYNDGAVLARSVEELFSIGTNLLSIAVVPVGLTRFRRFPLKPVDDSAAREICRSMGAASDCDRLKAPQRKRRLFLSDEFFLRAGRDIPPAAYYEDYPQIENGVGLVRQMLDKWKSAGRSFPRKGKWPAGTWRTYLLVTSCSAFPFLNAIAQEMIRLRPKAAFHAEAVPNRFFGTTVTVAGLLTARDVISAVRRASRTKRFDRVLLPAVMFNYAGYTLDGYSARRLAKEAGVPVRIIDSVEELLRI